MIFTCVCKWTYIVEDYGLVYGPIYEDWTYDFGRWMTMSTFEIEYSDCKARYDRVLPSTLL